jgi:hypothetical protein
VLWQEGLVSAVACFSSRFRHALALRYAQQRGLVSAMACFRSREML